MTSFPMAILEEATGISSFSHGLDTREDIESDRLVDYAANVEQVAGAIDRRLGKM